MDRPVYLNTARDRVLRYLDNPAKYAELRQRLALQGIYPAYTQAVREACPDLPRTYEDDVADMVRAALKARARRVVA